MHGIERHMPDRIIDDADKTSKIVATKRDGTKAIPKDGDYDKLQSRSA